MVEQNEESQVVVDDNGNPVDVAAIIANDGKLPTEEEQSREDWLPEKFKTKEDLVKSYSELEKTLKEKGKLAPDVYPEDTVKELGLDAEDEQVVAFNEFAKENNISEELHGKILKFAHESGLLSAPNYEEEMKALGKDADAILDTLHRFSETKLTTEEREVLESMTYTAPQVLLLNKMITLADKTIPAKINSAPAEDAKSLQKQLNELLSDPLIRNNFDKQNEAIALSEKIARLKR